MRNFNLSLRKTYMVAIMGTMVLTSCSTDDTPSEDVSAIRQAEAANLNANAQVAAAQAALINAQIEVEVAQAEQIKLENALMAIHNTSAQAESDLTIAQLQAQMVDAETARINAQLALNQAMSALDQSMAEMVADQVRDLMAKLSLEQNNLDQLLSDRNVLVKDLNLKKFNLEFGVDYSNESALIALNSNLDTQNQLLTEYESDLVLLQEDAEGKQDVAQRLNNLQSENIEIQSKVDSLSTVRSELIAENNNVNNQISEISNLKSDYEMYLNDIINQENNKESLVTTIANMTEQLVLLEREMTLNNTKLTEAQSRWEIANQEYDIRVEATAVAEAAIPALENVVEEAELAYNMAVSERNEYSGTDAAVISELDLVVSDSQTVLTDAQVELNDATVEYNNIYSLQNTYYVNVVAPEESTIATLKNDIDVLQSTINDLVRTIKDQEAQLALFDGQLEVAQAFVSENKEAYDQLAIVYENLYADALQFNSELNKISVQQSAWTNLYSNNLNLINYYTNVESNAGFYSNQVKNQEAQIAQTELQIKDIEFQIKEIENNIIVNVEDLQQSIDMSTDKLAAMDVQIEAQTGVITHYKDLLSQALAE